VTLGAGIPIHRHLQMDEAFYVLEGSGTFILNDVPHSLERGGTIFIPPKHLAWICESRSRTAPTLGCVACWSRRLFPRHLQSARRPPKQLTREQINEIARKYATEFIISRSRWTAEYCGKHARWKWRYRGPGRIVGNVPKMHASRVWQTPGNGKIPPDERVGKPEQ
jgi:hypothetical protein